MSFRLQARIRLQQQMADISECGGAARGDAIGGQRLKEFPQRLVDLRRGEERSRGAGKFVVEIVFARVRALVNRAVIQAQTVIFRVRGHPAAFPVRKLELAEVVRIVGSFDSHGEMISQSKSTYK